LDKFFHQLPILLLGDAKSAQHAAGTLSRKELWPQAIELSNLWRVIPQFRKRYHELQITLPGEALERLKETSIVGTAQSVAALSHCAAMTSLFRSAGVDSLAFKGVGLLGNLYASPSERMVTDIDILIEGKNLRKALETVERSATNLRGLVAYAEFLERQSYHRLDNDFLYLTEEDGPKIDLQWKLGANPPPAMEASRILERAEKVNVRGNYLKVASPADAMILTAHHAMRNNFSPAPTLKDLCDMKEWWKVQAKRWNVEDVVNRTRECGLTIPLMALWGLLTQYDADGSVVDGVNEFRKVATVDETVDSDRLQRSLNLQLDQGSLNADLVRILIDPSWIAGRLENKLRTMGKRSVDLRSHGEIDVPPMARRARMLVREIFRLNLTRVKCYSVMKKVEKTYSTYDRRPVPVTQITIKPNPLDSQEGVS